MLERLILRGFQKHERFTLNLDPLVTVLAGPSDRGKSSVLRALRWLALNQPAGDEFINWNSERVSVTGFFDGGRKVTRRRGKGNNTYLLDGQSYCSFGKGVVPDDVAALLNLGPENFQCQLDPPFWFFLTPGEVSKELNGVINLGLIDAVLSNLASEVRAAKARVTVSQERLETAEKQCEKLSWVKYADRALSVIEEKETEAAETAKTIARINEIIAGVLKADSARRTLTEAVSAGLRAIEAAERAAATRAEVDGLTEIIVALTKTQQQLNARIPKDALLPLETAYGKSVAVTEELDGLEALVGRLQDAEEELCQAKDALAAAQKQLAERQGEACPLCGTPMPPPQPKKRS